MSNAKQNAKPKKLTASTPTEVLGMVEHSLALAGEEGAMIEVKQHITKPMVLIDVKWLERTTQDTRDMVESAMRYAVEFVPGANWASKPDKVTRLSLPDVRYVNAEKGQHLEWVKP